MLCHGYMIRMIAQKFHGSNHIVKEIAKDVLGHKFCWDTSSVHLYFGLL